MVTFDVENANRDLDNRPQFAKNSRSRKRLITMDEAISKTKFGLFNYVIIFVSGVTLCAVSVETNSITYVIAVACDMSLTSRWKGILAGAAFFGVICSSHLWGYLADTKGRKRIIQPTLFMAFFLTIVCSFTQNVFIFIVLRFLNGFFISGSAANIFAYLSEFHDSKHRSQAIIITQVIFNGSSAIIPVVAYTVINQDWQWEVPFIDLPYKPWRFFMIVAGIPGFLCALALLFLPESPKFVLSQGNKLGAYKILQKMNRWNNGKESQLEDFEILEEFESVENGQHMLESNKEIRYSLLDSVWSQTAPLFKSPYLRSTISLCTIQFGIFSVFNGYLMFFYPIINSMSASLNSFFDDKMMMCDAINMKTINGSEIDHNEINSEHCIDKLDAAVMENGIILEITFTVSLAIAGSLLKIVGKFPVIFSVLLTTGLGGIGCMFIDMPFLQVALYVWMICSGIVSNILSTYTVDLYPTKLRAMAISISLMFGRLGCIFGANTMALLIDDNCETAFYLSGSMLIAMSILAFFIPNIHKRISNSDEDKHKPDPRLSIESFRGSVKS